MMCVAYALFVTTIALYCTKPSATSRTSFTREPLFGYRCVRNNPSNQTTISNTARAQCVWRCLYNDDCVVVSHNHHINSCELSMHLCDTVESHENVSINVYGIHRKLCSDWVPKSEFDGQKAIMFPQKLGTSGGKIAVARKGLESAMFPGKHQRFSGYHIIIAVDENRIVSNNLGEVLQANSACLFTWIPYSSPKILPVGAFVGGYGANKEPLYVARAVFEGVYSIGYYKSSKSLAYFMIYGQARTSITMDILVNLWHWQKISHTIDWTECSNAQHRT